MINDIILELNNSSSSEVLEYLSGKAEKKSGKTFVVSVNPEIIMLAREDREFEHVLKSADLALNDGVGVTFAAKLFGKQLRGRVYGSDLVEKLCERVSKQPITVGFLGGYENVAEKTAERLRSKYPGLKVSFAASEVDLSKTKISLDILFVAFGSPKQEKWIYNNLPNLDVRVVMGVGGAFDYISGKVIRAPKFIRQLGFEWLFRLIRQPWRVKRQFNLVKFVILVLAEKLS